MECLLPYLNMVTVPHIMVGLERMLDYRGVGLERFHCTCIHKTHVCTVEHDSNSTQYSAYLPIEDHRGLFGTEAVLHYATSTGTNAHNVVQFGTEYSRDEVLILRRHGKRTGMRHGLLWVYDRRVFREYQFIEMYVVLRNEKNVLPFRSHQIIPSAVG